MTKKILIALGILVTVLALIALLEYLYIRFSGTNVPAPSIPREPKVYGEGKPLTFVVMGDSTSVSQGGTYENGYAVASAKHLAENYEVTIVNVGISGATAKSVRTEQLDKAVSYKPDIVLLAVGANDVTHWTGFDDAIADLQATIDALKQAKPGVQIVFTRSAAVDAVSRFPIGAKQLIRWRVDGFNEAMEPLIKQNNLILAPVAEQTRQIFLDDPSLLAPDNFHPNDRGYAVWIPVINEAIDQALIARSEN